LPLGHVSPRSPQGSSAAKRLRLDDIAEPQPPALATAKILLDHLGPVAAGDDDVGHSLPLQPLELISEHRDAHDLHHGLGAILGEWSQPLPLPARKHNRVHPMTSVTTLSQGPSRGHTGFTPMRRAGPPWRTRPRERVRAPASTGDMPSGNSCETRRKITTRTMII